MEASEFSSNWVDIKQTFDLFDPFLQFCDSVIRSPYAKFPKAFIKQLSHFDEPKDSFKRAGENRLPTGSNGAR